MTTTMIEQRDEEGSGAACMVCGACDCARCYRCAAKTCAGHEDGCTADRSVDDDVCFGLKTWYIRADDQHVCAGCARVAVAEIYRRGLEIAGENVGRN